MRSSPAFRWVASRQAAGTTYGSTLSSAAVQNDTYFSGTGILTLPAVGLPGDFNSDGTVDAGDYITWKKNEGTNNALANDNGLGTPVGTAPLRSVASQLWQPARQRQLTRWRRGGARAGFRVAFIRGCWMVVRERTAARLYP